MVEPANNLQVLEFASKSMRLTWDPSFGDVSGYKIQVVPMMSGPKRQELYVGHAQTSLLVRDLAPDTEYQISLFALNGLTPSEAVTVMGKTESVQVSLGTYEDPCSLLGSVIQNKCKPLIGRHVKLLFPLGDLRLRLSPWLPSFKTPL